MSVYHTVLLLAAEEIPAQVLNKVLPSQRIYTMPYTNNTTMHALCGVFRDVGQAVQQLDAESTWDLRRFEGFSSGMFKMFKNSDESRWKDAHFKAFFSDQPMLRTVFDDGQVIVMPERRLRTAADPQPPLPPTDEESRAVLRHELSEMRWRAERAEKKVAALTAELQILRTDQSKQVLKLAEEWNRPIREMHLKMDARQREHILRLEAELSKARAGQPPTMGPFGPRNPGAF